MGKSEAIAGKNVKLILLGNGSVGKSSIIQRFIEDGFRRVYKQTVGCDFFEKRVVLRGDQTIVLQVWDIGGQSISSKMLAKYILGAHMVYLCYDITEPHSFADLEDWLTVVKRTHTDSTPDEVGHLPSIYVLGNKADLPHLKRVTDAEQSAFINANGLRGGFYVSAKSGENVVRTLYQTAAEVSDVQLTDYELSFHDKVLTVTAVGRGEDDDDGGRTPWADQIEAEDRAAAERAQRRQRPTCSIS